MNLREIKKLVNKLEDSKQPFPRNSDIILLSLCLLILMVFTFNLMSFIFDGKTFYKNHRCYLYTDDLRLVETNCRNRR